MEVEKTKIEGLLLIKPKIFNDERGFFLETFNVEKYKNIIRNTRFVQDNMSLSKKNVLRGIHFQTTPAAQGKLVQVINGEVLDIAVDLRRNSPTYGLYQSFVLNNKNNHQLWIPKGFGHAFLSKKEDTILNYKCSNYYSSQNEETILWNDPQINIDWGISNPILSEKDKAGLLLKDMITCF